MGLMREQPLNPNDTNGYLIRDESHPVKEEAPGTTRGLGLQAGLGRVKVPQAKWQEFKTKIPEQRPRCLQFIWTGMRQMLSGGSNPAWTLRNKRFHCAERPLASAGEDRETMVRTGPQHWCLVQPLLEVLGPSQASCLCFKRFKNF